MPGRDGRRHPLQEALRRCCATAPRTSPASGMTSPSSARRRPGRRPAERLWHGRADRL